MYSVAGDVGNNGGVGVFVYSVAGDVGNDGGVGVYSCPSHFFFRASLAAFLWFSKSLRLCWVR